MISDAKTFDALDPQRLPKGMLPRLRELESGGFLQRAANVLCFGLPGTGKTHAACALGHALVQHGHAVLFTPTFRLDQELLAAKRDLALPRALHRLDAFDVIILDDLGDVQQSAEEVELLFTLMAERYERRSMIIDFCSWASAATSHKRSSAEMTTSLRTQVESTRINQHQAGEIKHSSFSTGMNPSTERATNNGNSSQDIPGTPGAQAEEASALGRANDSIVTVQFDANAPIQKWTSSSCDSVMFPNEGTAPNKFVYSNKQRIDNVSGTQDIYVGSGPTSPFWTTSRVTLGACNDGTTTLNSELWLAKPGQNWATVGTGSAPAGQGLLIWANISLGGVAQQAGCTPGGPGNLICPLVAQPAAYLLRSTGTKFRARTAENRRLPPLPT